MGIRIAALCSIVFFAIANAAFADEPPSPEFRALIGKAEAGDADAQYNAGKELLKEKEYVAAFSWYEKAAAQGHALAINGLGHLYELGLGVRQDHRKGFELYLSAAELGSADAMWNISNMYRAGELGEPDMVAACEWAIRAERFSDPGDKKLRSHIDSVLPRLEHAFNQDQLAACRKDGESWAPPHAK